MEGQRIKRIIIAMNPPDFDPKYVRPELVGDRLYLRRFALIKLVELDGSIRNAPVDLTDQQIVELGSFLKQKCIRASLDRISVVRNSFVADCRGLIGNGMAAAIERIRQAIQDYFGIYARMSCLDCLARKQVCVCVLS